MIMALTNKLLRLVLMLPLLLDSGNTGKSLFAWKERLFGANLICVKLQVVHRVGGRFEVSEV